MVTGDSKIWVGIDNQPIELKKSNDGSLELNEWECLGSANDLNVGDYCYGAPLISESLDVNFNGKYFDSSHVYLTNDNILIVKKQNSSRVYSMIIPIGDPVKSSVDKYASKALVDSSSYSWVSEDFEVKADNCFKYNNSKYTYYYDISNGKYNAITEKEYNNRSNVKTYKTPTLLCRLDEGSPFTDYEEIQSKLYQIGDTIAHFRLSGCQTNGNQDYIPTVYTDNSIIFIQRYSSVTNYVIEYSLKKTDNMCKIGPKQAMSYSTPTNIYSAPTVITPYYTNYNTSPAMFGIVTAKIDSTHVIVAI